MKRFLSSVLIFMLSASLIACGSNPDNASSASADSSVESSVDTSAESAESSVNSVTHYPVTLKDQAGREVTIEQKPERVVSGYYISTSLVIALGAKDRLVGIEAKAKQRNIYKRSAPELMDLPSVGTAKEFDLEGCIALNPDLVILPKKLKDAATTLADLGIAVLLVNPESQELMDEARELVAKALDCNEVSESIAFFTEDRLADIEALLANAEKKTVYLAGNSAFLRTAPGGMYQNSLIELAGGINVAAGIEETSWVDISYEQLLAWDPEYIILVSDATYTVDDVLNDETLSTLSAIVNKKVYKMPDKAEAWDSPIPGSILGIVWVANVLHTDIIDNVACNNIIEEFYEIFYGFRYND